MLVHVNALFISPELLNAFTSFGPTQFRLQAHMEPRHYGDSIKEFFVGFICVSPEFAAFSKPRRDRYVSARKVSHRDGLEIVRERTFECEVLLPYDALATASTEEVSNLLSVEVIQAAERLYKHRRKLVDFDIPAFVGDVKPFFNG